VTDRDLRTDLLVIGAGPYAYSAAAYAQERGIDTHVLGRPMAFWRDQMPEGMFLRSGPDWSLDADGQDSFEAYFEHAGLSPADVDPIPIGVFLDHTDWFAERKHLAPDQRMVTELTKNGTFVATLEDGATITADKVLAAPGIAHYAQLPAWYEDVPADLRRHTSELVDFDDVAGKRFAIIGGRQSAYEWAALLCDHGAVRVDVVHRHETPTFEKVSWKFVDPLVEQALAERGWWRNLPTTRQQEVALQFWQVGRLTLEWWLTPRLRPEVVTSRPGTEVAAVAPGQDGRDGVSLTLTDGQELTVDVVVFASGYRADIGNVPYLSGVIDRVSVTDGFPDLSPGFETSLEDLYVTGFSSTRDFGPFYGFTKGCPSSARLVVDEMVR
jgi:cation diffusion facilitator CzcD-associated flavoprotein CzcO